MLKVAAEQPGGRDKMRVEVALNEPQAVGKSCESMPWFMDQMPPLCGNNMSWIMWKESELSFGTRPRGEVQK